MLSIANYAPRYLAYCEAQGRTPDEQMELDRERWPGGAMCGFIIWIQAQWQAFARATGANRDFLTEADHLAFDTALAEACATQAGQVGTPVHHGNKETAHV